MDSRTFAEYGFWWRVVWRITFAALGFTLTLGAVFALFYFAHWLLEIFNITSARMRVPVALFVLPVFGVFMGWKLAKFFVPLAHVLYQNSFLFRVCVLGIAFWVIVCSMYIHLFEPLNFRFGLDFTRGRYFEGVVFDYLKLIMFPPFVAIFGLFLFLKAKRS